MNNKSSKILLLPLIIFIANCSSQNYFNKDIDLVKTEVKHNRYFINNDVLKSNSVKVSVLYTGFNESREFLIYSGGGLNLHRSSHAAFYIRHPKGDFLFESGLGTNVDEQVKSMSWLDKNIFSYTRQEPVIEQLKENGVSKENIKTIILSHLHWDHASGLNDFPDAKVLTTKEEYDFAFGENAKPPAFIKEQYKNGKMEFLNFQKKRFLDFRETCDFYGDGSIIFVKLLGHTSGSIGMFIKPNSGKKLFFVGDTVWSQKQITENKSKSFIASLIVDQDRELLNKNIKLLNSLSRANPDLLIIPTHDFDTLQKIPEYPKFEQ